MFKQLIIFFLLLSVQHKKTVNCAQISSKKKSMDITYTRCPAGKIFNIQEIGSVSTRSRLDCMAQCSQREECRGVNVCPGNASRHVDCTLVSQQNPSVCDGLHDVNNTLCFFAQKKCQNGGRPGGSKCVCGVNFIGDFCQRFVRDCRESFDNGWQDNSLSGSYLIQPVTAPVPFQVQCIFMWGGITVAFQRNAATFDAFDWTEAKRGFYPTVEHFFVGLENLRHLLNQAQYSLHVNFYYNTIGNTAYGYWYTNFSVAPESSSYKLSFTDHFARFDAVDSNNFFDGASPVVFCSKDKDTNDCAGSRGSPSWYGTDCKGYSLFTDQLTVPINGQNRSVNIGNMLLQRDTDFLIN